MSGITRYADVHVPMDEALTRVAIDISGRPFLVFKAEFVRDKVGTFDTELVQEWFQAFAMNAGMTLHVRDALRHQRPSHRRILLQGPGAGAARRDRDRSARGRTRCRRPRARSAADVASHARDFGRAGCVSEDDDGRLHRPPAAAAEIRRRRPIRSASRSCATASFLGVPARAAVDAAAPDVAGAAALHRGRGRRLQVGLVGARRVGGGAASSSACWSRCWSASKPATLRRLTLGAARLEQSSASSSATIAKRPSGGSSMPGCAARRGRRRAVARAAAPPHRRRACRRPRPDVIGLFPGRSRERRGDRRDRRLRLGQSALGRQGVRARGAREPAHDQPIVVTRDPEAVARADRDRAARRRRLRRLPARARRRPRHGRGAGRDACAARAGRSSASASACS